MTQLRSAKLTSIVYDVSCGGVEWVPHQVIGNLPQAVSELKEAGFWFLGLSEHESKPLQQIQNDRPRVLVLGNEEKGIRKSLLEKCDERAAIVGQGLGYQRSVGSLNVATAGSIGIFHLLG